MAMTTFTARSPLLFAVTLIAAPAMAQDDGDQDSVFDGTYVSVGAGAAVGPSYEGSDDYVVYPIAAASGEVDGIGFQMRGPGVYLDLLTDRKDAKVDFIAGPVVHVRLDRINDDGIKDSRVEALGERDVAVEVGADLGVQVNRLLHGYDSLTFDVNARWDVAGAHDGRIIEPRMTYFTPLSRGIATSLSVSAQHMDDDFANYYFTVTPTGAAASGLPAYRAEGGWKSVGANLFAAFDFDGDLENGGWAIFANGSYKRLTGDAKDSPVTSVAGEPDQWMGALGVGYTF